MKFLGLEYATKVLQSFVDKQSANPVLSKGQEIDS